MDPQGARCGIPADPSVLDLIVSPTDPRRSGARVFNDRLLEASRGALELWLDASRWWAGVVIEGAGSWREENARVLSETAQGLARKLEGREVNTECAGRPLVAIVDAIQFYRDDEDAARLKLRDIDWDGLRVERLSIFADEMTISPPPSLELSLRGVALEGRVRLRELVAWLDRELPRWQLAVTADNLIEAVPNSTRASIAVAPRVLGGEVEVELRELRWRALHLRLPAWLRLVRTLKLSPLPEGVAVREANLRQDVVEFVIALPDATRPLTCLPRSLARAGPSDSRLAVDGKLRTAAPGAPSPTLHQ
jgi:hypothetical protein